MTDQVYLIVFVCVYSLTSVSTIAVDSWRLQYKFIDSRDSSRTCNYQVEACDKTNYKWVRLAKAGYNTDCPIESFGGNQVGVPMWNTNIKMTEVQCSTAEALRRRGILKISRNQSIERERWIRIERMFRRSDIILWMVPEDLRPHWIRFIHGLTSRYFEYFTGFHKYSQRNLSENSGRCFWYQQWGTEVSIYSLVNDYVW